MATSGSHTENLAAVLCKTFAGGKRTSQLLLSAWNYMEIKNTLSNIMAICAGSRLLHLLSYDFTLSCSTQIKIKPLSVSNVDSWASESFLARRKSLAKDVRKISGVSNSAIISLCKFLPPNWEKWRRKNRPLQHLLEADKDSPCRSL